MWEVVLGRPEAMAEEGVHWEELVLQEGKLEAVVGAQQVPMQLEAVVVSDVSGCYVLEHSVQLEWLLKLPRPHCHFGS